MSNLNYLIDHILYQMLKTTLNISIKDGEKTDNASIRKCSNKIENRITFEIKIGYYLQILTSKMIKFSWKQ